MTTKVCHRNLAAVASRIRTGLCNLCFIGDSLDERRTFDRMIVSVLQQWRPAIWRGAVATTVPWNLSGNGEPFVMSNDLSSGTKTTVPMGGDPPGTLGRGLNLRPYQAIQFTADLGSFYQYICQFRMPDTDATKRYWPNFYYDAFRNCTVKAGVLYATSGDSVGVGANQQPRLAIYNRANGRDDAGRAYTAPRTNPGTLASTETAAFAMGTGSNNNNSVQVELQFGTENESTAGQCYFHPIQFYIVRTDVATGLMVNWCSQGGATANSHLAAGDTITADSQTFLSGYTDAALLKECQVFGYNVAWIKVGNNRFSGQTRATYKAAVRAIGERWVAQMTAAGTANPMVVLESPHPTDTGADFPMYQQVLEELAIEKGWGFMDTYGECMREFGTVAGVIAAITASGYGPIVGVTDTDAIHYSAWGVRWRASKTWEVLRSAENNEPFLTSLMPKKPRSRRR